MQLLTYVLRIILLSVFVVLTSVLITQFDLNSITEENLKMLVLLNILLGIIIIMECIRIGLKECFSFFIYIIVYIIFNLGYYIINFNNTSFGVIVYGYTSHTDFYSEAIGLIIMLIGMISLYVTYLFSYMIKPHTIVVSTSKSNSNEAMDNKLKRVRQWSKIIMYLGAFFAYTKTILSVIQVQQYGYSSLYTNIASRSNIIIDTFDAFYEIGLLCYLSTNPPLKHIKSSITLYIVYSILTLFSGVRGPFIINILLIVWYLMKRDNLKIEKKKLMSKVRLFFFSLAGLGILYGMKVFSQVRHSFGGNVDINKISFSEGVFGFVEEMGFSGRLISVAVYYQDQFELLSYGKSIIYPVLNYFQNNVISRILGFGFTDITSLEYLNRSYNFGAWLSYIFRPDSYFNGGGIGTNYLAEAYISFGFVGVILINFLIGKLLRRMDNFKLSNWKANAFSMNILSVLLFVPRDTFLRIIPESITMIIAIVFIDLISNKKVEVK